MHQSAAISHEQKARLMRRAAILAMAVAGFLVSIKAVLWMSTGSLSVLSTMIDSLLDVGMSAVNFFAVRAALMPADSEHRFGHGKAEALAALSQALFILASCAFLVFEAVMRVYLPSPIAHEIWAVAAMMLAIALTYFLTAYQAYVVRMTGSMAIASDRLHYKTDIAVNIIVLIALGAVWLSGWDWIDSFCAAMLAIYLLFSSRNILMQALDVLLDRELPDDVRENIIRICKSDPESHDIHDLRTRMAGPHMFIQFHLELDPYLTLAQAHAITDRIEQAILDAYPNAEVSIHQEPAGIEDRRDNF